MARDTFTAVLSDAAAQASAAARKAVAAVKPYATLDNAIKAVQVVNGALDAAAKVRQIKPPTQTPKPQGR